MVPAAPKPLWLTLANPRPLVLIALALVFYSQHLEYQTPTPFTRTVGDYIISGIDPGVTGWTLHPYAFLTIAALAAAFLSPFHKRPFWARWGYWIAFLLLFINCTSGEQVASAGGRIGGFTLLLALVAGFLNTKTGQYALSRLTATASITPP